MNGFLVRRAIHDGVMRSIRALFNDSGGRNMPRVLTAFTGFWPTVPRRPAMGLMRGQLQTQTHDGHLCQSTATSKNKDAPPYEIRAHLCGCKNRVLVTSPYCARGVRDPARILAPCVHPIQHSPTSPCSPPPTHLQQCKTAKSQKPALIRTTDTHSGGIKLSKNRHKREEQGSI